MTPVENFRLKFALIFLAAFFAEIVASVPLVREFQKDGFEWWEWIVIVAATLKAPTAASLAYLLNPNKDPQS